MSKAEIIASCEVFRSAVIMAINNMQLSEELKGDYLVQLQTFYLQMLTELLETATPPSNTP